MLQETQKSKEKAITEIRCMVQEQDRLRREIQQYRYEDTDIKKDGQSFYKVLQHFSRKYRYFPRFEFRGSNYRTLEKKCVKLC
jgi:hypothetical protein